MQNWMEERRLSATCHTFRNAVEMRRGVGVCGPFRPQSLVEEARLACNGAGWCQKTRLGFLRLIDAVLPECADGSGNGGKESQVMSTSMMGAISQVLAHLQAIKHLDEETPVSGID